MKLRRGLLLLTLASAGCAGAIPAAIGAAQQQHAESVAREKELERRAAEKEKTKEYLADLKRREREFDAGLAQLKELQVRGEDELEAAAKRWRAMRKQTLAGIPYEVTRTVKLSQDPDRRQFEQEAYVPRREAYDRLVAKVQAAIHPTIRMLIKKGIAGHAPLASRTLLFPEYNREVNTADPELVEMARRIAAEYDGRLLDLFREYGGYGKLGPERERVGCVFSKKPWPEPPGEQVEPRFSTHFRGKGTRIYVLGRLPLQAKRYGGRQAADIAIELISQSGRFVDVGARSSLGTPEGIGDARFVTATFKLPPPRFDHTRFFFIARVVLTWEDGRGRRHRRILSQSSFTWEADG